MNEGQSNSRVVHPVTQQVTVSVAKTLWGAIHVPLARFSHTFTFTNTEMFAKPL